MSKRSKTLDLAPLFAALADRTRLRLLNLIAGHEVCVCYLVEVLGLSQPKISRHLAYLRKAGVVAARREGKWMHYRLVQPADAPAAATSSRRCSARSSSTRPCRQTSRVSPTPAASLRLRHARGRTRARTKRQSSAQRIILRGSRNQYSNATPCAMRASGPRSPRAARAPRSPRVQPSPLPQPPVR